MVDGLSDSVSQKWEMPSVGSQCIVYVMSPHQWTVSESVRNFVLSQQAVADPCSVLPSLQFASAAPVPPLSSTLQNTLALK